MKETIPQFQKRLRCQIDRIERHLHASLNRLCVSKIKAEMRGKRLEGK